MEHINELLNVMSPVLEQYGYLALIISIFLEGVGIPMPGQSLMIAASIMASRGVMNLPAVMLTSWLACFIGNSCGYLIGYYFEGWLDKKGYISGQKMQKMQSAIQKYGPICLVVSRFIEGMKQFMPLACGIAKMPRREFIWGNALATTIWVLIFSLLSNFVFAHLHFILNFYSDHQIGVWFAAALVFIALIGLIVRRRKSNKRNSINE
ncbi:putative integral membrane protein [Vibrio ichthyoenteri ATCC 700023]|uniref:Putative integral membrane protein n=1 Tax=Vibrio ichthyoenteri ATCC 700023 TaxID=870968 RepID=F9S637_9VIBR|nr:DedA family protein [Vibrio ichthyoenteri]EGU33998.1 putative integral membrane protein [Vibrio ichthyoenteri ATCC 700023]